MSAAVPEPIRRALRAALIVATAGILTACGPKQTTLLESDVPSPPGFEVRFSEGITREDGTLSAGRFLLSGSTRDVGQLAGETAGRFTLAGWQPGERTLEGAVAKLVFTKDLRRVDVEIDGRLVSPPNSVAILIVSPISGPPVAPTPAVAEPARASEVRAEGRSAS